MDRSLYRSLTVGPVPDYAVADGVGVGVGTANCR